MTAPDPLSALLESPLIVPLKEPHVIVPLMWTLLKMPLINDQSFLIGFDSALATQVTPKSVP